MRGIVLAIVLALGCGSEPPRWSAEELRIEEVTGARIAVAWPQAEGATVYVVRIDGRSAARLGPEARSYAADELEEASEHTFAVQALDDAGNASVVLRASATTLDVTAPGFAEDARLEVSAEPVEATVRRRWPEASDNVAVARYRALRGDEEVALVEAPETSVRVSALTLAEAERFAVRPIDGAGNEAPRGLETTYYDPRYAVAHAQALVEQRFRSSTSARGSPTSSARAAATKTRSCEPSMPPPKRTRGPALGGRNASAGSGPSAGETRPWASRRPTGERRRRLRLGRTGRRAHAFERRTGGRRIRARRMTSSGRPLRPCRGLHRPRARRGRPRQLRVGDLGDTEGMVGSRSTKRGGPASLDDALWEASRTKDGAHIRLLLEAGADPNHTLKSRCPLREAIDAEAEDVVGALIEGGASLWGMATHVHRSPTAARACLEAKIERLDDTLRTAASTGHAEVVRILLEGGVDAGARSKRRGETALVSACRKGHVEIARMLLDSGVDPEVKGCVDISKPGRTERVELCALEAAACASAEVVALLLERGVNRDAIGSAIAWAGRMGRSDCVELLRGAGASSSDLRTAALEAARNGATAEVRALLDRGVELDGPEGSLLMAAMRGALARAHAADRLALVEDLFARGPRLDVVENGTTLLHLAASLGVLAHVDRLLAAGASVHAKDANGVAPLRYLRRSHKTDVLERFLAAGADPDAPAKDGSTLLGEAARFKYLGLVQRLLAAGADPNGRTPDGDPALTAACSLPPGASKLERQHQEKIVELLLEAGADPTAKNARGETPLGVAARCGCDSIVKMIEAKLPAIDASDPAERAAQVLARAGLALDADGLLAVVRGGRVSDALKAFADAGFAFDSDAGYAALIEAIGDEKIEVARFLIQRGAPLRSERPNPLCRAASTRSSKMIDALLALGADPNALGSGGMTPLAIAVEELATGCVRSLLRAGADPNLGRTPPLFCITTGIRHAIEDGYRPGDEVYEIVRALAAAGADLELRCAGDTPLLAAVKWGYATAVRALIEAGADPEAKDESGKSARELAVGKVRDALEAVR